MHKDKEENGVLPHIHAHDGYRTRELGAFEHGLLDGDMFLQVSSNYVYIPSLVSSPFTAPAPVLSLICLHQFCLGIWWLHRQDMPHNQSALVSQWQQGPRGGGGDFYIAIDKCLSVCLCVCEFFARHAKFELAIGLWIRVICVKVENCLTMSAIS